MADLLARVSEWITDTQVLEQIRSVDADALFHNPYFLVPFICVVIHQLYKQAINNLAIMALCIGLWYFSGTDYVRGAVVGGEVQIGKILPIAGVGVAGIAVLIYLVFIRQD